MTLRACKLSRVLVLPTSFCTDFQGSFRVTVEAEVTGKGLDVLSTFWELPKLANTSKDADWEGRLTNQTSRNVITASFYQEEFNTQSSHECLLPFFFFLFLLLFSALSSVSRCDLIGHGRLRLFSGVFCRIF